jgi:tol-pal system protein YbgF
MHTLKGRISSVIALVALVAATTGCVTVAELRKLERRTQALERGGASRGAPSQGLADIAAQMDSLENQLEALRGRIDVAEKTAADALLDSRKARQGLAELSAAGAPEPAAEPEEALSDEVRAYRAAYAAWRDEDAKRCIDQFRVFLQSHPASAYADDAAFWMADCHFKQGDFKNAVLRFDDVVRNYPTGNKAPDALFRQGEALMKLGPGYHQAAKRAFERVLKEYPESARVAEARRQLEVVGG